MNLLHSWKESLMICLPEQAKLFFLITVRSLGIFYYTLMYNLVKYWWLLVLLIFAEYYGMILIPAIFIYDLGTVGFWVHTVSRLILSNFVYFIMLLTALPSLLPKGDRFYAVALKRFWYLLIIARMLPIFSVLFILDSDASPRGVGRGILRGITMLIYNLPIVILFILLLYIVQVLLLVGLGVIFHNADVSMPLYRLLYYTAAFFIISVDSVVFTNLYIKKLHEQSDVYYPQPK